MVGSVNQLCKLVKYNLVVLIHSYLFFDNGRMEPMLNMVFRVYLRYQCSFHQNKC